MNKTYINILCVLILGLLAIKILLPFFDIRKSLDTESFHELTETHTPFVTEFSANKLVPFTPTDTLTFSSGDKFPIITRQMNIFIPDRDVPRSVTLTTGISYMLTWALVIFAFYEFIRFIININRNKIFVQDNVKRLKLFAWSLLLISALNILAGMLESHLIDSLSLDYSGRNVKAIWDFPWTSLMVGISSLLIAQIWSKGIHLKEDNELTI